MAKKKTKSPFLGFEVDDVLYAEANFYVVQVGEDLFEHKGKMAFSKDKAILYYNQILEELTDMYHTGTPNDRKRAKVGLSYLKVLPLRIN